MGYSLGALIGVGTVLNDLWKWGARDIKLKPTHGLCWENKSREWYYLVWNEEQLCMERKPVKTIEGKNLCTAFFPHRRTWHWFLFIPWRFTLILSMPAPWSSTTKEKQISQCDCVNWFVCLHTHTTRVTQADTHLTLWKLSSSCEADLKRYLRSWHKAFGFPLPQKTRLSLEESC